MPRLTIKTLRWTAGLIVDVALVAAGLFAAAAHAPAGPTPELTISMGTIGTRTPAATANGKPAATPSPSCQTKTLAVNFSALPSLPATGTEVTLANLDTSACRGKVVGVALYSSDANHPVTVTRGMPSSGSTMTVEFPGLKSEAIVGFSLGIVG